MRDDDPCSAIDSPRLGRPLAEDPVASPRSRACSTPRKQASETAGEGRAATSCGRFGCTPLIETLYATGLRVTELVTLPPLHVLTGDGRVLTIKGKGGRERLVPLNRRPRGQRFDRYLNVGRQEQDAVAPMVKTCSKWLFASRGAEGHLTRQGLGRS